MGEVFAAPARRRLAEGEIVAEYEADEENQDRAEEHDATGFARMLPAAKGNEIETVVGGGEHDQHQKPRPGHDDRRGIEELTVENLHEEKRSDAQGDGRRQERGQLFGEVKEDAAAMCAGASNAILPQAPERPRRA